MAKGKVTKDDWTMAALTALARGGVAAVAVDVLAKELEVSRGSFYWHFKNRDALLVAALEAWERLATGEVIEAVNAEQDPMKRARALFAVALGDEEIAGLEPAIVAQVDHPAVAEVLHRVTRTRLAYLTAVFSDLGLPPETARLRAVAAYAAYLGWIELRRAAPQSAPETLVDGEGSAQALDHLVDLLTSGISRPPGES
ncbi:MULTISPECIES: TetR/AcrR family transcriptional regulator [unclassified Streptomyces]|uniref:TetR/AcrR family transcriptional regulator n=1 Tax=unclassified Streptomyces TaxID=2593676 RepID=UPI001BEA79CB|nr:MULTISPECIES: TetR/AcrR family transcriptional regulator [unclassified Streptomyces]MBT2404256.1 TetR/AcrR family transcriptional regulator [Streptomyces sp. ISL-21]MBT2456293.1 TetR/AcrR family transcriptional regulator [Streptomyces sp. ISL-86]MBT2612933.1 TetR/AcrR family transcriptional regulator [Streptomyces sp. ISL-87]